MDETKINKKVFDLKGTFHPGESVDTPVRDKNGVTWSEKRDDIILKCVGIGEEKS